MLPCAHVRAACEWVRACAALSECGMRRRALALPNPANVNPTQPSVWKQNLRARAARECACKHEGMRGARARLDVRGERTRRRARQIAHRARAGNSARRRAHARTPRRTRCGTYAARTPVVRARSRSAPPEHGARDAGTCKAITTPAAPDEARGRHCAVTDLGVSTEPDLRRWSTDY